MFRTISFAALLAASLLASVNGASAQICMNGGGENGIIRNGEMPNGEMPNGEMPNGYATQGAVSTGLTVISIELPRAQ
jgi:hypothetical protein